MLAIRVGVLMVGLVTLMGGVAVAQDSSTICQQGKVELRFGLLGNQFRVGDGPWKSVGFFFRGPLLEALAPVPQAANPIFLDHVALVSLTAGMVWFILAQEGSMSLEGWGLVTLGVLGGGALDYFLSAQAVDIYNREFARLCS